MTCPNRAPASCPAVRPVSHRCLRHSSVLHGIGKAATESLRGILAEIAEDDTPGWATTAVLILQKSMKVISHDSQSFEPEFWSNLANLTYTNSDSGGAKPRYRGELHRIRWDHLQPLYWGWSLQRPLAFDRCHQWLNCFGLLMSLKASQGSSNRIFGKRNPNHIEQHCHPSRKRKHHLGGRLQFLFKL